MVLMSSPTTHYLCFLPLWRVTAGGGGVLQSWFQFIGESVKIKLLRENLHILPYEKMNVGSFMWTLGNCPQNLSFLKFKSVV